MLANQTEKAGYWIKSDFAETDCEAKAPLSLTNQALASSFTTKPVCVVQ